MGAGVDVDIETKIDAGIGMFGCRFVWEGASCGCFVFGSLSRLFSITVTLLCT